MPNTERTTGMIVTFKFQITFSDHIFVSSSSFEFSTGHLQDVSRFPKSVHYFSPCENLSLFPGSWDTTTTLVKPGTWEPL